MGHALKHPVATYRPRLKRLFAHVRQVKNLPPYETHLWKVMDTPAFEDTETALEMVLNYSQERRRVS